MTGPAATRDSCARGEVPYNVSARMTADARWSASRSESGFGNRRATSSGDIDPSAVRALHSACLMQLEFHQLDRRWEHLRVRHPARQRRLLASLADSGQQTPIVVAWRIASGRRRSSPSITAIRVKPARCKPKPVPRPHLWGRALQRARQSSRGVWLTAPAALPDAAGNRPHAGSGRQHSFPAVTGLYRRRR